jgi:4-hydroxy-tetrahydrodipicolinate synthase
MNYRDIFSGVGTAIITPFNADGSIDFEALASLIEMQIAGGVNFIVTLGTTGETPVLSKQEKVEIINITAEKIDNRIPLVVGVGGNNTAEVIHDLQSLPLDKATAVLSASPYYNKPSQQGLIAHYKAVAAASPKPIILYNVPGRTGRNMSASTTLALAVVDNIIGIKEASGDMQQVMDILKDAPTNFFVTSGDDNLALPQIACGAIGVISVASNVYPASFSKMVHNCLQNNFTAAVSINNSLMPAYQLLFEDNNPAGAKAFLASMGKIKNELRLPAVPVPSALQERINDFIKANSALS